MFADGITQLQLVLRLALALVFFASAGAKLREPAAFVRGVRDYQVLPRKLTWLYAWSLPYVEIITAVLLVTGLLPVVATGIAVLLLGSFAIAIAIVTIRGQELDCHCFGTASGTRVGWHTFTRDLLLLAPASWLLASFVTGSARSWPQESLGRYGMTFVLATLLALTYWFVTATLDLIATIKVSRGSVV